MSKKKFYEKKQIWPKNFFWKFSEVWKFSKVPKFGYFPNVFYIRNTLDPLAICIQCYVLHDTTTVATLPNTTVVIWVTIMSALDVSCTVGYCLYGTLLLRPRWTACYVHLRLTKCSLWSYCNIIYFNVFLFLDNRINFIHKLFSDIQLTKYTSMYTY